MKSYLIIPMGGKGKRFVEAGFKTYKAFLPISKNTNIFEKIISNFKNKDFEIILIANFKLLKKKYSKFFTRSNLHLINIKSHKKGPMYSLYLGREKINEIVKKNENIFICYSDINWKWDFQKVFKNIKNKEICVFTHKNYHPHLEINSKSDFCKVKKDKILDIREKKTFSKDYKKDYLAIGCYFIKNLSYLNIFFDKNKNIFNKRKEIYFLTLIKYFLNIKYKIGNFNIKNFVHLGTPEQYLDYQSWSSYFKKKQYKSKIFKNKTCIMLMGGKGRRVSNLIKPKPFLDFRKKEIYRYIFDRYNSKKEIIITNDKYKKKIHKKFKIFSIRKTNSMFESVLASKKLLSTCNNYFLTSCDCFGEFNYSNFKKFTDKTKSDLNLFAFKHSNLQKSLGNSHTQLEIKNYKIHNINVKKKYKELHYGHAGFFWIKSGHIFDHLNTFKNSEYFKKIRREILIDDYFKFLIVNKLISSSYFILDNYIHIGSEKEYLEYLYWEKYNLHNDE